MVLMENAKYVKRIYHLNGLKLFLIRPFALNMRQSKKYLKTDLSEEDILTMANPNSFADRKLGTTREGEDSFQEIAKSGTSETPSDFSGDHDSYNTLYDNEISDGAAEEIEEFTGTDINGQSRGFVRSDASEKYEAELDDEGIESPLGDIPYHERDSYIDGK